jgi:hypothetical protein
MLHNIITRLSDYENKKVWGDLYLDLYKNILEQNRTIYVSNTTCTKA